MSTVPEEIKPTATAGEESVEQVEEEKSKRSDEEILFPEAEVAGIKIRPWSFGILFDIAPSLESVLSKATDKGLLQKLEDELSNRMLNYVTIAHLFTLASSDLLDIITHTLNIPKEEIKALGMTDGMKIVSIIYSQNREIIKNALGLLLQ